jgi:hypothetical protein
MEMLSDRRSHNFSTDFFPARSAFRELAERAGGRLEMLPLDAHGPNGQSLGIDIAWFGAENPRRVVVHSSGLHGVEGFAGSAIQIQALTELPALPDDTALILVHILNPYGMSWLRRANESNVDLNRNALGDESYTGVAKAYSNLDSFLNPQSPPSGNSFLFFLARAALLVIRHGMLALRQAVAGGQYEYPKGLFFGGKKLEQGLQHYGAFLARRVKSAERVIAIDVHTGLGKYAEDTLLADPKNVERLRRVFGRQVTSSEPEAGPAYRVRGGLESLVAHSTNADVLFVTQEFGTYGPIKNLYALREENRWHHYGKGTLDHPAKRALKAAFNPDDETWRTSVVDRGLNVLKIAIAGV